MRRADTQPPEEDEDEIVMFLERDQLVADRRRPLPPANIGRRAELALWTLRIFVLLVGLMVIFTFCAQLNS
jgi:hypothetical protein